MTWTASTHSSISWASLIAVATISSPMWPTSSARGCAEGGSRSRAPPPAAWPAGPHHADGRRPVDGEAGGEPHGAGVARAGMGDHGRDAERDGRQRAAQAEERSSAEPAPGTDERRAVGTVRRTGCVKRSLRTASWAAEKARSTPRGKARRA